MNHCVIMNDVSMKFYLQFKVLNKLTNYLYRIFYR